MLFRSAGQYCINSTLSQITQTLGSTSIRYRSDAKVSDRYLIDIDPQITPTLESTSIRYRYDAMSNRHRSEGLCIWGARAPGSEIVINTPRPDRSDCHFADWISWMKIVEFQSKLHFVSKGPINNMSESVRLLAWRRLGDILLPESVMI